MQITAKDLSELLGGDIEGNAEVLIRGPSKLADGAPGTISFYANSKYEPYIYSTNAFTWLLAFSEILAMAKPKWEKEI